MARKAAVSSPSTAKAKTSTKPAPGAARGKAAATVTSAKPAKIKASGKNPAPAAKTRKSAPPAAPVAVTLKQLAAEIGEQHDFSPRQAQAVLTGVVELLVDHLKAGDKLRLKGLGVLEVKNRPARTARNPATGAPVKVAASKKITFRPAKDLKDAVLG